MSILLKGIAVRPSEVNKNYNCSFEDLTKDGQIRLFLENVDLFFYDACISQYSDVRHLTENCAKKCKAETIEACILELTNQKISYDCRMVLKILDSSKIIPSELFKKQLSRSYYWPIRIWVAKQKSNSNAFLQEMFLRELPSFFEYDESMVIDVIVVHPSFNITEDFEKKLKRYGDANYTKILSRLSK